MSTSKRSKKWFVLLGICAIGAIGVQFIRPKLDNPPVTANLTAPAPVENILRRACYDCHSNETRLPWFDRISPAIWLVAKDVREGRAVLNFSHWDRLTNDQRKAKLFESLNQVTFETMPPKPYRMLHPEARLTEQDLAALRDYVAAQAPAPGPNAAKADAGRHQYEAWLQAPPAKEVQPTKNGIAYMPDYKSWTVISTTDRFDNGTMRVITANDIAMKAIEAHAIDPWPDGSIFAKIVWDQVAEADGSVHPGEFKAVEFMIKDGRTYASTAGWGWARWRGPSLQPYGESASFTTECVNCHAPMKHNDFVFTAPLQLAMRPNLEAAAAHLTQQRTSAAP
ncbi:heme-binding domain-containing protein [Pendulispora albinea]|uniref:Heme-binding domain-containing protein n=1 Tax=Pendulispora albinea TaxID=2741071 RepID=A0ABZ2M0Y2_9BACT